MKGAGTESDEPDKTVCGRGGVQRQQRVNHLAEDNLALRLH